MQAQPPLRIDWLQDQMLWGDPYQVRVLLTPGHQVFMTTGSDAPWIDFLDCASATASITFSPGGHESMSCCQYSCMEGFPLAQTLLDVVYNSTGAQARSWLGVAQPQNHCYPAPVDVPGSTLWAGYELTYLNGNLYSRGSSEGVDGNTPDCFDRIWRYGSGAWTTCVGQPFTTMEAIGDTILAVGFPMVTLLDMTTGSILSGFELMDGGPVLPLRSCMAGDTLFWIAQFGGADLRVGSYRVNSGELWQVSLPFTGEPLDLFSDGFGRLWSAAGNELIWIDRTNGDHDHYPFGLTLRGLDLVDSTLALTGSTDSLSQFVLKATVQP